MNTYLDKFKIFLKLIPAFFRKLTGSLNSKERVILVFCLFIFLSALPYYLINFYLNNSKIVPSDGGVYSEGIVGKSEFINPVLAKGNEIDLSLTELIYSGLMKYDENNQLVNDVASGWKVNEDRTEYTIDLKQDVYFVDGEELVPLTAEDVLFTINTIQNSRYKSPLRPNWLGVEVRTNGDYQIIFTLKKPFVPFLHNLTFGILPKHIWKDIGAEEFQLSEFNKAPVGSGPYVFYRSEKQEDGTVSQTIFKVNKHYHLEKPHLETLLFKFYSSEDEAITALNNNEIMAMNDLSHRNIDKIQKENINLYEFSLPRYYAIFLNVYNSEFLAEDKIREALAWATCREEIINEVLMGSGQEVNSPVLTIPMDNVEGFEKRGCSIDKAKEILEKEDWKLKDYTLKEENNDESENEEAEDEEVNNEPTNQDEENTTSVVQQVYFNKSKEPLKITLTTADFPELIKTAEVIKRQWEQAGILVELEVLSIGDLNSSKIEPREYEALLFGEILKVDPDPRPYWHSGERKSPGQNIVGYNNSEADELLDKGREEENEEVRREIYQKFQLLINKDIPAIFLYSPYYLYPANNKLMGVKPQLIESPSWRFSQINNWYLEQKRIKAD